MDKEANKNIVIQELTEENERLRTLCAFQQQQLEGFKAFTDMDEDVWNYPHDLKEAYEEVERLKEEYTQAYQETIKVKAEIETSYRQQLEELLASIGAR